MSPHDSLARTLLDCALEGARALLAAIRDGSGARVTLKADGTPVTAVDLAADQAVRAAAARLLPHYPLVSEEAVERCPDRPFLLLDPLDGTREFLEGGAEFCVALACIEAGRPVAGVIVAPLLGAAWTGADTAWRFALDEEARLAGDPVPLRLPGETPPRPLALVSRQHAEEAVEAVLARLEPLQRRVVASAVKFGLMAEGQGDLMLRYGRLKSWDVAAGEAVLAAAGGITLDHHADPIIYDGRADWSCPPFVAASGRDLAARALAALQRPS